MKVLYCHNYYQQAGGEDNCAHDEIGLLRSRGHEVYTYTLHNDSIASMNHAAVAWKTLWNSQSAREVSRLIEQHQVDVLHAMNTFPLISPSVYYAAHRRGAAVVQSLQNYRLVCPGAYLMRDGKLCTDCVSRVVPWPAIQHRCYRDSFTGSATVVGMLVAHRILGTYRKQVDRYIVCTEHGKRVFVDAGLPADRVSVKPNFIDPVPDPGDGAGGYVLFAGRLSPEKGVTQLFDAWRKLKRPIPLKIVGDGPLSPEAEKIGRELAHVEMLGWKSRPEVDALMAHAAGLIVPSLWFEGFPKTQLEAMALGTPTLASNLGSMSETVKPWVNGLHFEAGNVDDMTRCVEEFYLSADRWERLRETTRAEFVRYYGAETNYDKLIKIYREARETAFGG